MTSLQTPSASPSTLNELFLAAVERFKDRSVALRWKPADKWVDISYRELRARVEAVSLAMADLGIRPGDRVALLSENRPQWAITDYAATSGPRRKENDRRHGTEPGDPVRAAEAIVMVAQEPHPPFRLLLGSDAVERAREELDGQRAEIDKWERLSLSTDLDAQ